MSDDNTNDDKVEGSSKGAAPPDDTASPEAIARRVAALGGDDQAEALAMEEERKLAERKASKRKAGPKRTGLEVAASKKLAQIGDRPAARRNVPNVAVAADVDPLLDKTLKVGEWAKQNQKTVQVVGALIAAALLGMAAFTYIDRKREGDASTLLTKAVEDDRAQIGEPPKDDENTGEPPLMFKTFDERRESALKKFRDVQSKFPRTGAAILARLAEGSLLLDKHEVDAAATAFGEVKASALASADREVRGRALEGLGFAHELKAAATPAEAAKHYDAALAMYKELETTAADARGFTELAQYHQARVTQAKGDKDKAKEMLVALKERLAKADESSLGSGPPSPAFPYLKDVVLDRLHDLDPTQPSAKAAAAATGGGHGGGAGGMDQAKIRKMIEEAQKKQKAGGH